MPGFKTWPRSGAWYEQGELPRRSPGRGPLNQSKVKDEVVINDRWGKDSRHKHGGYWTAEYTPGMADTDQPWEESRGMGFSYGYNRAERLDHYKSGRELVIVLADIVSRGRRRRRGLGGARTLVVERATTGSSWRERLGGDEQIRLRVQVEVARGAALRSHLELPCLATADSAAADQFQGVAFLFPAEGREPPCSAGGRTNVPSTWGSATRSPRSCPARTACWSPSKLRERSVLHASDMPRTEEILVEEPEPEGPFGAKGVGEIGLVPSAAAVVGTLFAFDGVRRTTLPMKYSPATHTMSGGHMHRPHGEWH